MAVRPVPAAAASEEVGTVGVGLVASALVQDLAFEETEDTAAEVEVEEEAGRPEAVGEAAVFVVGLELVARLVRRRRLEHLCRRGPLGGELGKWRRIVGELCSGARWLCWGRP